MKKKRKTMMRYFTIKERKTCEPCYYWNCPPAKKYGLPTHEALGNDYAQAIKNWEGLFFEYSRRKKENKIFGFCIQENENIIENQGTLIHMRQLYFNDRRFLRLAPRTQKNYKNELERLTNKLLYETQKRPLGTLQVKDVTRPFVKTLYEKLLANGHLRAAELTINALHQLIITAKDRGLYEGEDPCTKLVMEHYDPRDQFWTKEDFELFCKTAAACGYHGLHLAFLIAYYTAQRQTDIENLKWTDFDNDLSIWKLHQSKTGALVELPLYKMPALQQALKNTKHINDYVINSTDGKPYKGRSLIPEQTKKIKNLAGIEKNLVFRDLRRTAILRLDEAGCTPSEIASISGHSRQSIIEMLETYAPKSKQKAINAMDKLENYDRK